MNTRDLTLEERETLDEAYGKYCAASKEIIDRAGDSAPSEHQALFDAIGDEWDKYLAVMEDMDIISTIHGYRVRLKDIPYSEEDFYAETNG